MMEVVYFTCWADLAPGDQLSLGSKRRVSDHRQLLTVDQTVLKVSVRFFPMEGVWVVVEPDKLFWRVECLEDRKNVWMIPILLTLTIALTVETRFLTTRFQRSRGKQESRLSHVLRETTSWWWVRSSKSPSLLLALTNDMSIIYSFRTIICRHYHYWTCKVWHHAEHEEPSWKPPLISDIESGQWTYRFASIVSLVIVVSISKIKLLVRHNDCDAFV